MVQGRWLLDRHVCLCHLERQTADMLQEVEERSGAKREWRVKMVEREGQKISEKLVKDPWTCKTVQQDRLPSVPQHRKARSNRKRGGSCTAGNSCCYMIECRKCRTRGPDTILRKADDNGKVVGEVNKPIISYYIGESARKGYTR